MALWFDKGVDINSYKDTETYQRNNSGLRMKDRSVQNVQASYHLDRHVQLLLEINREAEITQAIDRLRLLRGSDNDRQVFIATSIPVDVTVDYYWDWKLLQRLIKLLDSSDVLPVHPEHFLKVFTDDTVKTLRGAEDLIRNLKTTLPLIDILIKNYVVFKYQHADSRKAAQALILKSVKEPKQALKLSIGVEITTCYEAN
jgi:hypothetical protein